MGERMFTGSLFAFITCFTSFMFLNDACEVDRYPQRHVERIHQREVAAAESLGFQRAAPEQVEATSTEQRVIRLGKEECVAVVASASGRDTGWSLSLRPSDTSDRHSDWARHESSNGPVHHVQACTHEPVELRAQMNVFSKGVRTEWTVLTAPSERVGGNAGLNRGWVPLDAPPRAEEPAPTVQTPPP
ncbi:MAG TPA: hypothetical protein VFZ09_41435 [Archangium sp.]|uniref:hypothetical protein n=1 Tax=Archangium sp. TaxID=1872627 RepID=UPI002E35120D|nr:hypothetical protein [Archangium sp.]HEX5752741.1 hypothetical protein [Archangium sp.]